MKKFLTLLAVMTLFIACGDDTPPPPIDPEEPKDLCEPREKGSGLFTGNDPKRFDGFYYDSGRKDDHDHTLKIENGVVMAALEKGDVAGAWNGRNFQADTLSHFGRYSARLRIPCVKNQPLIGAVVGFYTFYNDEWSDLLPPDINENGIFDNSEIDFEWLIADPQIIYLTAWTDYQEFEDGTVRFGKVGRIINMATGQIISTNFANTWGNNVPLTGDLENYPATIRAIPNYDASKYFYTYGFDWETDRIRWWIINPEDESDTITLWDYRGPKERITQKPARLSFNFWHTNNWSVITKPNTTQAPQHTFWTEFAWVRFEGTEVLPPR